jgi:hypothetical protein
MVFRLIGPHLSQVGSYAGLLLVALLPLCVVLASQSMPSVGGPVAAVFPPWWDGKAAFVAAGSAGRIVRLGALPFIVIVTAAERRRLRTAGAWLLLDPRVLGGCAPAKIGSI